MPGWHNLIFSKFRGSFSATSLLPAAEHLHTVFSHTARLSTKQRNPDAVDAALSKRSSGWFISTVAFPLRISELRFCCNLCKVLFANALKSGRKKQTFPPCSLLPAGLFWKAALMPFMEGEKSWLCPLYHQCRKKICSHGWLLHKLFRNAALIQAYWVRQHGKLLSRTELSSAFSEPEELQ